MTHWFPDRDSRERLTSGPLVHHARTGILFAEKETFCPKREEAILSELYDEAHRSFQDQHDSRRLADQRDQESVTQAGGRIPIESYPGEDRAEAPTLNRKD